MAAIETYKWTVWLSVIWTNAVKLISSDRNVAKKHKRKEKLRRKKNYYYYYLTENSDANAKAAVTETRSYLFTYEIWYAMTRIHP